MKNMKKWLMASGLFGLALTLSGCVDVYKTGPNAGQPTGNGLIYNFLVKPMSVIINYLVDIFGNYGVAVIVLTIIVRLLLFPLMLHQTKKSTYMSEKMAYLKPQMTAIQEKLKMATSPEEQMAVNKEMKELYAKYDVSMFGGIGCLPLLIQMPIFTALFFSVKYPVGIDISNATFLGINLSQTSLLLTILAGLAYLLQSFISMIGIPEEQKKQMKMMLYMSPLMITFISFSSPAGVTLYWVVGGLFSCLQSLYTNLIQKPKIKAEIEEMMRLNPPEPVEPIKNVTPTAKPATKKGNQPARNLPQGKGRNAGKQQRNK